MALMERPANVEANASTTELVKEALDEAKELVRIEVALAKDEVRHELKEAKGSGIAFGVAAFTALLALGTLLAVLVVVIGPIGGLIVAGALMVVGGVLGFAGYKLMPKKPLAETRGRVEKDVHSLKERMA